MHASLTMALVLAALLPTSLSAAEATALELNKPVEASLRAGETHHYAVALNSGDFVKGTVTQRGIPINVKGFFPDGAKIRSFGGADEGAKGFRFVAEAPGAYKLELKAADSGGPGSYKIEIQQIQPMAERLKIVEEEQYQSPRLIALRSQLDAGNRAALADFWRELEQHGTPLAEPQPGDDENLLVTFLWRATFETHNVLVVWSPYTTEHLDRFQMSRLGDTDLWYKTIRMPKGARFTYQLSPNDTLSSAANAQRFATAQADPLNPHRRPKNPNLTKYEVFSIAELPGAPAQPWAQPRDGVKAGKLEDHRFRSTLLGNERGVTVYLPADYRADGTPYGLLVLFDKGSYLNAGAAQTTLDNLIADRKVTPLVAVLLGSIDDETRTREYVCNPKFADFLATELLPWVREKYRVTNDPRQVTVGGVSHGGLAAVYATLQHPECFGNALSQSGTFWWTPGKDLNEVKLRTGNMEGNWIARQFIERDVAPQRFFLEAGRFENDIFGSGGQILETNRQLRDVLRAKGYQVTYQDYAGGHDFMNWRGGLADGLIALYGESAK